MKDWFLSRDRREQWLLGVFGALLFFWIIWAFLLSPILSAKAQAQTDLIKAQNDYRMMMRAAPLLGGGGVSAATQNFDRSVMINLAQQRGIRLTRVQPETNGNITVWIDDVPTQNLYAMFETLLTNYKVEMDRVAIAASPQGLVSAQFTLTPLPN